MKTKLLIFDIDGTLCNINSAIDSKLVRVLQEISSKHQIVLASGKPFGYIAGLVRQIQLQNCMVIAENGGTIMYSATFPPSSYYQFELSDKLRHLFADIKNAYAYQFGRAVWFQPNEVNLTIFPVDISCIDDIHKFAQQYHDDEINVYYHKDSVDFVPKGIDKGTAVEILLNKLNFKQNQLYVFGDGDNDLPMLAKTKNTIVVNNRAFKAKVNISHYDELRMYLNKEFCSQASA